MALGTEEQNGLFGAFVVSRQSYLRSLAVILLAYVLDKQTNRYVYASDLIARSPSVALGYAVGDGRDRGGLKQDLLREFLKYLVQADLPITSKRGAIGMKHLLADAAFLAPSLVDEEGAEVEDAPRSKTNPTSPPAASRSGAAESGRTVSTRRANSPSTVLRSRSARPWTN